MIYSSTVPSTTKTGNIQCIKIVELVKELKLSILKKDEEEDLEALSYLGYYSLMGGITIL